MKQRVPLWVIIMIIVVALPVAAYPTLLSMWPSVDDGLEMKTLLWFYPAYVIASGVFAYICWPSRRTEAWILLALMLLSHAAMWGIALTGQP